jgi:hypothetical protein
MIPGLMDTVKGLASGIFGKDGISGLIDNITTNKEEKGEIQAKLETIKNSFETKVTELILEREKIHLADIADARSTYARVQESEKSSWMAKNIMPILTMVVTVGFFGMLGYMLKYEVPESNERIMDILLGSLGTAWITMVSFYFGSSKGSEDKSKHIIDMQKN